MKTFENTANIGDTIKAFDFKPMNDPDYPDRFLVGKVVAKGRCELDDGAQFDAFTVEVTESPEYPERVGHTMYVPFEMFMDFDNRVTKIA